MEQVVLDLARDPHSTLIKCNQEVCKSKRNTTKQRESETKMAERAVNRVVDHWKKPMASESWGDEEDDRSPKDSRDALCGVIPCSTQLSWEEEEASENWEQ